MCPSRQVLGRKSWRHLKTAQNPALSHGAACVIRKTPGPGAARTCPVHLPVPPASKGEICGKSFPAAGGRVQEWRGNKRNKPQRVVGQCAAHGMDYTIGVLHQPGLLIWMQRRPDSYTATFSLDFLGLLKRSEKFKGFSQEEKWPRCSLAILGNLTSERAEEEIRKEKYQKGELSAQFTTADTIR